MVDLSWEYYYGGITAGALIVVTGSYLPVGLGLMVIFFTIFGMKYILDKALQ